MINYSEIFKNSLDKLKSEGNYRIFADLEKLAGNFPQALNYKDNSVSEVTVWCSNDYLRMSQNQDVLDSMTNALKKALNETKGCSNFDRLNHLKKIYFNHCMSNTFRWLIGRCINRN